MNKKIAQAFEIRTPEVIVRNDIGSKIKDTWNLTKVDVQILKEKEKAFFIDAEFSFRAPNRKMWIPKSLVKRVLDYKMEGLTLELPTWFAIENGL